MDQLDMFRPVMLGKDDWRSIFAPNGVILTEEEIIHRTNYSKTLAAIAAGGSNALYHGEIAEAIVRKVQSEGGVLSLEDLANYKVKVRKALQGTYRGRKVYTTHAPTSGPVLLHMLNLLEAYDLPAEGRTGLNVHRYVEAMKCE